MGGRTGFSVKAHESGLKCRTLSLVGPPYPAPVGVGARTLALGGIVRTCPGNTGGGRHRLTPGQRAAVIIRVSISRNSDTDD